MLQDWRIRDGDSEMVVEAETWLEALAIGMGTLDGGAEPAEHLACTVDADGSATARDSRTGRVLRVSPVSASEISALEPDFPTSEAPITPAEPSDPIEDLFLQLGELSACGSVPEASAAALRIALDRVPAGAGAVLIRTRAGDGLRFRAASGPVADELVDTVIPLHRGVAGWVCQLGMGITLEDVRADVRHDPRVDRSTGFVTQAMLAVPVRADGGAVHGVLELINPSRPFSDGDCEVVGRVAASLGTLLNEVYTER